MTRVRARSVGFHAAPGRPGAKVTVARSDGSEVTGQVQYPHPAGRSWAWVSLWNGRAPVAVQFALGDRTYGYEGGRP